MSTAQVEDAYNLTPMQEGLLIESLCAHKQEGLNLAQQVLLVSGRLREAVLRDAWQETVNRHPVLRSAFTWEGPDKPRQVVFKNAQLEWTEYPISLKDSQQTLQDHLDGDRLRGFDLSRPPLVRIACFTGAPEITYLVISSHHLILDGWSRALVLSEVFDLYDAKIARRPLNRPRPPAFRDYIAWLQQRDKARADAYWSDALSGATGSPTLARRGLAAFEARHFEEVQTPFEGRLWREVLKTARRCHVTPYLIVLCAWALLLSRYGGGEDVVFGSITSGRHPDVPDIEKMVGLCINAVPVRVRIRDEITVSRYLQKVHADQAEAREYDFMPPVEWRKWISGSPGAAPFETLFVYENYPRQSRLSKASSLSVTTIRTVERPNYPLTVLVNPGERFQAECLFNRNCFDPSDIQQLMRQYRTILEEMVADPTRRLATIRLLTLAEREKVVHRWNSTKVAYRSDACAHDLFAEQAGRTPARVAVVDGNAALSYEALNVRANRVAQYLRRYGVGPEVPVGLCMGRGLGFIVGLLGVLKSGGAYVPLDPAYPGERLAHMLGDSRARVLLTEARLAGSWPSAAVPVIRLDADWPEIARESGAQPPLSVAPENLAYIMYTSGSTGAPKGVGVAHRGLANVCAAQACLGVGSADRVWQFASPSFDASVFEVVLALTRGATLVMRPDEPLGGAALVEFLERYQISTALLPPSLLEATSPGALSALRVLAVGGETCPPDVCARWAGGREFWNLYGPTEYTIVATAWKYEADRTPPPIGRPIANTHAYVLDGARKPVAIGLPGDLYVSGAGLARGYWNRPALTAEKFVPDPFSAMPGGRMYRTGDRARWLADGTLEFLGRVDRQVKLHGFRIELEEIETTLLRHPDVRESVVERRDENGHPRLVAYVVPRMAGPPLSVTALRSYLTARLPGYMVPGSYVFLDRIPVGPNGKVDRRALPPPEKHRPRVEAVYEPPDSSIQNAIAEVWCRALGLSHVGVHDNFFDAGGDSLSLLKVYAELKAMFGEVVVIVTLFEHPTIASLATYLTRQCVGVRAAEQSRDTAEDLAGSP